jgi:hypothetical protein
MAIYPHTEPALGSKPQTVEARHLSVSHFMGWQMRTQEAEILAIYSWAETRSLLGDEHPVTSVSEALLGIQLMNLGRYEDALAVRQHPLGIAEQKFASRHSRRSREFLSECLVSIGGLNCRAEQFAEAETYLLWALKCLKGAARGAEAVSCVRELAVALSATREA